MKFKNVTLALVVALAVSCGSKETKDAAAATDTTTTDSPAATEAEAPATVKDMLAKEWMLENVDYTATLESLPAGDKAGFKSLMDEMIPLMKGKNTYTFNPDGSAEITAMGPDKKIKSGKGTWSLSADEKTLTVVNNGQSADLPIVEVTADRLSVQQQKLVMVYVPKL